MVKKKSDMGEEKTMRQGHHRALRHTDNPLKKQIKQLKGINVRMNHFMESAGIGGILVDLSLNIQLITPIISQFFELNHQSVGKSLRTINVHSNFKDLIEKTEWVIQNKTIFETEIEMDHDDWKLLRIVPDVKKEHEIIGAIITLTNINITNLKIAEEKLYHMAHYDALTQLPNRSMFIQLMMDMIEDATNNNTKFVLLFMDLDNFNRVNDSLGHAVGDALLKTVATILKKLTRRQDVVARLGGDEFGIIIKNIHSKDEVEHITQRYIQAFTNSLVVEQHEIKTTPSIGLVMFPQYGHTPYELLQNADAAMYYAKQHGKNSYYFFDQTVKEQLIRRHAIDTQLQHALDNDEFYLVYQPKFNLKTSRITGVEALIRWNNVKLGEVLPDEFIPIAEENRLIVPIGYWLLEQVIKDYVKIDKIMQNRPFSIAVNMSMIHLSEPDFEFQIKQLLFNHRFSSCDKLIFELTETALMERPEIVADLLCNISKVGITFALDDFGTGFSSMQHIKTFPISSLKIDKSFIRDICNDSDVATMVRAMIAFTKTLEMKVTAEGVESHEQLTFLKKEGCDEGQGFILREPLSLNELLRFLLSV